MKTWANRNCVFSRQSCKCIIRGQTLRSNCMKIENSAGASIQSSWHPYGDILSPQGVREDSLYIRVLRGKWREKVMNQSFLGFMTCCKEKFLKFQHAIFGNAYLKPCQISQITQSITTTQSPLFYHSTKFSEHGQLPPMPLSHSLLFISPQNVGSMMRRPHLSSIHCCVICISIPVQQEIVTP